MRRRRRVPDEGRSRLLWDAYAWLQLADHRHRLKGVPAWWPSIDDAIVRMLTADELAMVREVVAGDADWRRVMPPEPAAEGGIVGPSIAEAAGVRFVPGVGYTDDPLVVEPVVDLADRRRFGRYWEVDGG